MTRTTVIIASALLVVVAACGNAAGPRRTDVPEPAAAPGASTKLPGMVVPLAGEPEGLALDTRTGALAVAVRNPAALVLVDPVTGAERVRIPLGGAARHLALAAPGGPVLVPSESDDRLYRVSLPGGAVLEATPVGRQPHDVAPAAAGAVFVGDELADTVHRIAADGTATVLPGPVQPGGVAASSDGSTVVVVGVRGRRLQAYAADGTILGSASAGVGPTHVRAGAGRLFYVADTQGAKVLVYEAGTQGVRQVGAVSTGGAAPYGLAVDSARARLYVTLTATNELASFRIDGRRLVSDRRWATVRQPNDVVVDPSSGRVIVAGTAAGQLQLLDPGLRP